MNIVEFRDKILTELQWKSYGQLAECYGVNKYYIYKIANDPYYTPTAGIASKLDLEYSLVDGIYLPTTTKVIECAGCGRRFFRTSNAMKYCRKDCR